MIKKILSILFVCFYFKATFAQQLYWSKNSLRPGSSSSQFVEVDLNGDSYNAGYYTVPYYNGFATAYYRGFFIEKRNSLGSIIWQDTALGSVSIGGFAFDGSFLYVTGGFTTDSIVLGGNKIIYKPSSAVNEGFFAKYDLSGNVIWAKPIKAWFLKYDMQSIYSIGGQFLSRYDTQGNLLWQKQIAKYTAYNLTIADSNNIYVKVGNGASYDPDSLKKYDCKGNLIWAQSCPGYGHSIASDSKGNCYLSGEILGTGNYISKYNSIGQQQWNKFNYSKGCRYIYSDKKGRLFSGGNDISNNAWFTYIDSIGNPGWTVNLGNYTIAYDGSGISTENNSYFVSGYSNCSGNCNVGFVAKISDSLSVTSIVENKISSALQVFPNPTSDIFELCYKCEKSGTIQISIYDAKGNLVYKDLSTPFSSEYRKQINLGNQASGIYFIEAIIDRKKITKQLVIN